MEEKHDKDTALAKVSILISKFYEKKGREDIVEIDIEREELIEDIEDILRNTKISVKHLVVERLEADDEIKEELKHRWKADGTFK